MCFCAAGSKCAFPCQPERGEPHPLLHSNATKKERPTHAQDAGQTHALAANGKGVRNETVAFAFSSCATNAPVFACLGSSGVSAVALLRVLLVRQRGGGRWRVRGWSSCGFRSRSRPMPATPPRTCRGTGGVYGIAKESVSISRRKWFAVPSGPGNIVAVFTPYRFNILSSWERSSLGIRHFPISFKLSGTSGSCMVRTAPCAAIRGLRCGGSNAPVPVALSGEPHVVPGGGGSVAE